MGISHWDIHWQCMAVNKNNKMVFGKWKERENICFVVKTWSIEANSFALYLCSCRTMVEGVKLRNGVRKYRLNHEERMEMKRKLWLLLYHLKILNIHINDVFAVHLGYQCQYNAEDSFLWLFFSLFRPPPLSPSFSLFPVL